jgi:hypothetical protein
MKSFVVAGLVAAVAALPQAASDAQCAASADGKFTITTIEATSTPSKRDLYQRQLSGVLTMTLKDGKLTDQAGRDGYIASNYQFQFDGPVQAGALETEGFGLCSNGSLSLKGSTLWYSCKSGSFYNLYSKSIGDQCIPTHIQAVMGDQNSGVSQIPDGQPQASTPAVTQISDGQPQASAPAVTQISDGQPQASAPAPPPPVTQISDGQPQASAPAPPPPVTQISDGQPQASAPASAPPVTQISDGQPQASAPQPPAPTATSEYLSETSAPVVSQISDGQPQVSAPPATAPVSNHTGNATTPPIPEFTGAAATTAVSFGVLVGGFFAFFSFL